MKRWESEVKRLTAMAAKQVVDQQVLACYLVVEGKAARTPVQTGVSNGTWVEVAAKLVQPSESSEGTWVAFDGSEDVIVGDLSLLADGTPVEIAPEHETKVANEVSPAGHAAVHPASPTLAGRP